MANGVRERACVFVGAGALVVGGWVCGGAGRTCGTASHATTMSGLVADAAASPRDGDAAGATNGASNGSPSNRPPPPPSASESDGAGVCGRGLDVTASGMTSIASSTSPAESPPRLRGITSQLALPAARLSYTMPLPAR